MNLPRRLLWMALILASFCGLRASLAQAPATAQGAQPATTSEIIRTETNLVLVDVVAMDKKGSYVRDLDAKEFRVFEDDKEQPLTSFMRTSDLQAAQAAAQPRYLVLFFDNSTMNPSEQLSARHAAAQFVEKSASPDRLMAVVDFASTFRVTQNFTANPDALKRAVGNIKYASLQPNEAGQTTEVAQLGAPSMVQIRSDFAARSVLLAIRNLAKTLRPVPGRKTMIFFSGGFPLTPERQSELTATIDAANKANVAIYPVDVRGLEGLTPLNMPDITNPTPEAPFPGRPPGAALEEPAFPHEPILLAARLEGLLLPPLLAQRPGGGGGGGAPSGGGGGGSRGGTGGGGGGTSAGGGATGGGRAGGSTGSAGGTTSGSRGTTGGTRGGGNTSNRGGSNPNNSYGTRQPGYGNYPGRSIIPPLMDNIASNQQVLYALAAGTGGFTIFNTNDFVEGLNKIVKELDEYYVLGYAPPNQAHDGSYHQINVKVERKGVKLRFRNGYYDVKSPDLLAGKPEGKILEERAASAQPGDIPVSLNAPYFYTAAQVARVNLAMEVPAQQLNFEKEKGKFHSDVHVLGIAYREDNSVAARFSDTVKLDMEKKELKEFSKGSFAYQNSFNIAPGKYKLKIVLAAGGEKFGKYEMPLVIEPFDGHKFQLSGLALSNHMQQVSQLAASLDEALLEERTPLVVKGVELIPSPDNRFKRDEKVGLYLEVYEPLMMNPYPPRVGILYDVVDRKTNQQVYASNTVPIDANAEKDNPVIPFGLILPLENLQAGDYRLEVRARDAAGNVSPLHTADFALN
ncbi:MAG: VWA domain-containing protein [Acidobacteriia bacterium]|nr:VWA domain-containing protein [Terriglobia bacterium]